jgi:hypothetical protein
MYVDLRIYDGSFYEIVYKLALHIEWLHAVDSDMCTSSWPLILKFLWSWTL